MQLLLSNCTEHFHYLIRSSEQLCMICLPKIIQLVSSETGNQSLITLNSLFNQKIMYFLQWYAGTSSFPLTSVPLTSWEECTSSQLHVQSCHVHSLKEAMVGVFTPQKSAYATNELPNQKLVVKYLPAYHLLSS